jgi:hypothetical protein
MFSLAALDKDSPGAASSLPSTLGRPLHSAALFAATNDRRQIGADHWLPER